MTSPTSNNQMETISAHMNARKAQWRDALAEDMVLTGNQTQSDVSNFLSRLPTNEEIQTLLGTNVASSTNLSEETYDLDKLESEILKWITPSVEELSRGMVDLYERIDTRDTKAFVKGKASTEIDANSNDTQGISFKPKNTGVLRNDYSQNFINTGLRPQNYIRETLETRFYEYPKLRELITLKRDLAKGWATPPLFLKADLSNFDLKTLGCKFDVILIDPPLSETFERSSIAFAKELLHVRFPEGMMHTPLNYKRENQWSKEDVLSKLESKDEQVIRQLMDMKLPDSSKPRKPYFMFSDSAEMVPVSAENQSQKDVSATAKSNIESLVTSQSQQLNADDAPPPQRKQTSQYVRPAPRPPTTSAPGGTIIQLVQPTSSTPTTATPPLPAQPKQVWSWDDIASLKIEEIAAVPSFVFLWTGDSIGLERGREILAKWGYRRAEDIVWIKTNKTWRGNIQLGPFPCLQHQKEHLLVGIRGTLRRSTDTHFIHCNVDTDVIVAEEPSPEQGFTKPEEIYSIIENFCLGRRRLELFGKDANVRPGWVTVGPNLSESNFNPQTYRSFFEHSQTILPFHQGIEILRPKSPPVRGQNWMRQ
ncbi:N6-adenosine-methyltransferase subunit mettl14 [Chytridiales sp. JEL 0842]|nr:N6-adenosine-methyltransferase subunit mettl14 [Chytridiales sp. JEL 0842]